MAPVARPTVIERLRQALAPRRAIALAYLHGSFLRPGGFRDIDVALLLNEMPPSALQYELALEVELPEITGGIPVDVRVLNGAPIGFKYNVIKQGVILVVRDDLTRADFVETTLRHYFDMAPHWKAYLKETLGLAG